MPISRINPDGTVKIYGKKSGKVLDVRPEDLGKYAPELVGEYQQLQASVQGVSSGQLTPADLPQDQRNIVATGLEAGGFDPARKEAQVAQAKQNVKNKTAIAPVEQIIKSLEESYQASGGGKYKGPLAGLIGKGKSVSSALGMNSNVRTYENTKKGFLATLKSLTGDVGVLTEQDAARLAALVPEIGNNPNEAKNAFNILRSQLAAKYGDKGQQTGINPGEGEVIPSFLVDPYKRTGQNVIAAGQAVGGLAAEKSGNQELAQKLYSANVLGSQERIQKADENPLGLVGEQALDSGSIILDRLGLKGLGKAKAAGFKPQVPTAFSKTKLSAARDATYKLYEGTKVSGKEIADEAKDFIARNPAYKKVGSEMIEGLEKRTLTPKQLVEQIADWSKGTYDKGGDVYSAQSKQFQDLLAKAGRERLRQIAPETAKINTLFSKLYGKEKLAKKAAYTAIGAVPTIGAGILLNRLLGGREG